MGQQMVSQLPFETQSLVYHRAVVKLENSYGFNGAANHKFIGKVLFIKAQPINPQTGTNQQCPKIIYDE
jgi:hypothetical protein